MKEKVIEVISKILAIEVEEIKTTDSLTDLGCDSLDFIEIIVDVEHECGVTISDPEAEKVKTVQDLVNVVESLVSNK